MPNDQQDAERNNAAVTQTWIKDGSAAAEPVTTSTPATPPATPAAEAAAPELVQIRNPDGTLGPKVPADMVPPGAQIAFAPKSEPSSATHSPEASASAAATPPASGASAEDMQDFIEAQLNGQPFKLPKGIALPMKRGDAVEYEPLELVQRERLKERDYRFKTSEVARTRREAEALQAHLRAEQAALQARLASQEERERLFLEAQRDPEAHARLQEHYERYRTDPQYKQMVDDALAKRETDARLAVHEQEQETAIRVQATEAARSWIAELATDFPGVDPNRVRAIYAQALREGQASLDPAEVRAIYEREANYLTTSVGPLQQRIATLEAQIAALSAGKGAEKHNAATDHALARAKAPPAATGRPPAPAAAAPAGRFGVTELPERNSQWANQR